MVRLPFFMISGLVWSTCVITVDASSCGGTFISNYGEINSPHYSFNNGYKSCVWRIEGAIGSRLVIGFKNFSLENQTDCGEEYIEIRHGHGSSSKYCGSKIPEKVITQSQNASIVFVTNHYTSLIGFHLYWKVFTKPVLMASPVSWDSANSECELIGGKLIEPDLDYLDTYRESIIEWMGAHSVSNVWVRKYFTPWVFLKGCTSEYYVHPQMRYKVKNNQQKICQNLCSGFNYFGLQKSNCVCLNDVFSSYDSCSYRCDGNTDEMCGGFYAYTVYKNNFCYTSSESWNGTLTQHIYGSPCLPWNQTSYKSFTFPDGSANDAKNNCRDPNGYGAPWCFHNSAAYWAACDVFKCLDLTATEHGSSECVAVFKNSQGMIQQQMPCSSTLTGVYMRLDSSYMPQFNETSGTWTDVRNYAEQFSRKFPLSTPYEYIYERYQGRFIWTGLSRNTSSLRPLATPTECFKLQRREQTLHEKSETCNLKLPFFCQKDPVNCGDSLIKTELGLNFTIDSGSYDINCIWRIEGVDNTVIRIDISFDIEDCPDCECDSLKIYDALLTNGPPNKTVCGSGQVTFNSTQKALTIVYTSDRSEQGTGFQAKWNFVSLPSKATTPVESTTQSDTGSEDESPFSSGLIGGIIAAVVVITASIVVCVFVIRRRKPRRKREAANKCATEMVTTNNETESLGDIYAVSAKVENQNGNDSVEYGVVNKRRIHNQVSSSGNIPLDPGKNSSIAERTSVDCKRQKSLQHGYDRIEKIPGEATEDDEYNRLNEIMGPEYVNKSDNVYNHVQGIDNDIYDQTADNTDTHDRRASYSHVKGPFPSSEHRHDVYDHTTDDFETPDRRDLYSHVRGPSEHRNGAGSNI